MQADSRAGTEMNINQIGSEVLKAMAAEAVGSDPDLLAAEIKRIQADPVLTAELQRRIRTAAEQAMRQQAMAGRARR